MIVLCVRCIVRPKMEMLRAVGTFLVSELVVRGEQEARLAVLRLALLAVCIVLNTMREVRLFLPPVAEGDALIACISVLAPVTLLKGFVWTTFVVFAVAVRVLLPGMLAIQLVAVALGATVSHIACVAGLILLRLEPVQCRIR